MRASRSSEVLPSDFDRFSDATCRSASFFLNSARVGADNVGFVVNGMVVHSEPKSAIAADGIYGIRINHLLEVHLDGFGMSK